MLANSMPVQAIALPRPDNVSLVEDADGNKPGRRKACDLCFTKKIKCDMLKPVCSNCKLYKAQCRTSIIRRKANPPRPRPMPDGPSQLNPTGNTGTIGNDAPQCSNRNATGDKEALEDRLARIERHLQQVLEVAATFGDRQDNSSHEYNQHNALNQQRASADNPAPASNATRTAAKTPTTTPSSTTDSSNQTNHRREDVMNVNTANYESAAYKSPGPFVFGAVEATPADLYALPPLQELLPIVDHYFNTFNSVVPLFNHQTFMRMLNNWFDIPATRHKASWAAILIVAAIGMRMPRNGFPETGHDRVTYANCCLRSAQSVVSELVNREEDLLGIQVLLGIVVLFRNSSDPRPASVIIATAMRLAHRLQLHSNASRRFFSQDEFEQRARVFWIAYSLDKTISLRTRTPSVQLDADIDTPLPPSAPTDGVGLIWTLDGRYQLNYHRQRAELAHIEGKVFDLLYSNRATRVMGPERRSIVARLGGMLDAWYERIPVAFHIENIISTLGTWEVLELTKLHHSYLYAVFMANGLYSHNSSWAKQLSSSGKAVIQDLGLATGPDGNLRPEEHDAPPMATWDKFVELSRGCMRLFQYTMPTECLIWQCSCAHFSSLIVLLANTYMHPTNTSVAEDQTVALKAVHYFDRSIDMFKSDSCRSLRYVIHELLHKANTAVEQSRASFGDDGIGGDAAGYVPFPVHLDIFPDAQDVPADVSSDELFEAIWDPESSHDSMYDVFGMDSASIVMAPIADVA